MTQEEEIIKLKERILDLETKIWGCSEEEFLYKERIKNIKCDILNYIFDHQPIAENDLLFYIIPETKQIIEHSSIIKDYKDVLNHLLENKKILIEDNKYIMACITPTGRTDCHGEYVLCFGNSIIKCAFCGR